MHDVEILPYQEMEIVPGTNSYELYERQMAGIWDLQLEDGVPAWPRMRAMNPGEDRCRNV